MKRFYAVRVILLLLAAFTVVWGGILLWRGPPYPSLMPWVKVVAICLCIATAYELRAR